jgi:hypothetical protein
MRTKAEQTTYVQELTATWHQNVARKISETKLFSKKWRTLDTILRRHNRLPSATLDAATHTHRKATQWEAGNKGRVG